MSIASKTATVLLIVFAALFGGTWFILEIAVRPTFERQDIATHQLDRARVEATLAALTDDLRTRVVDYATWDETYSFINGDYPDYVADNFADTDWLRSYGVDLAIYFDDSGRTLWSKQITEEGAVDAMPAIRAEILSAAREMPDQALVEGALWTASLGPIMYVATRATRTDGQGPPRGYVVFGRRIDADRLEAQTQLGLEVLRPGQQMSRFEAGIEQGPDYLRSLIPLHAPNGEVAGGVVARSGRHVSAIGANAIVIALLSAAAVIAAVISALWFLVRRALIKRIARIEQHFNAQSGSITPLPADAGGDAIAKLTEAYNDLTHRLGEADQRAREALLERESAAAANRMKSDFLANISFELRTPLNDVIGYADLIDEDLADRGDTSARNDLHRITTAARNMLALITELLDLSRIEADRLELAVEAFDVEEVYLSAAAAARPSALAHNAVLTVIAPTDLGSARTDQGRLRQCLLNVLTHATRRSQGGTLTLRAERQHVDTLDMLHFEITDCGPSLNEAQIAGLSEPFLREDDERLSGARLGIAVTRKLLELLGGSFEVTANEGRGCTYVLNVPASLHEQRKLQRGGRRRLDPPAAYLTAA